jgi:LacI family transcriptional regulator
MHLHFDAFDVVHGLTPADAERSAYRARETGIRGVVLLPSRASDEHAAADAAFLAGCKAAGLPVCLIARYPRGHTGPYDLDLVARDDMTAAAELTRHLIDRGRKRIAIVTASPVSSHHDRIAGYLFALAAARTARNPLPDLCLRQANVMPGPETYAQVAAEVLKHKADAVVCYSDNTAAGLIPELLRRGHRVPNDVAVVGFDDLPLGDPSLLGITSFTYPSDSLAENAVRLLRERHADPDRPPVKLFIQGKLVVRASSVGV